MTLADKTSIDMMDQLTTSQTQEQTRNVTAKMITP